MYICYKIIYKNIIGIYKYRIIVKSIGMMKKYFVNIKC